MPDPDYKIIFQNLMSRLSEGGNFLKSSLADIETGKRRGIASSMQNLVSSGLSGTTIRAGVPIAAEEVAGRARLGARSAAEGRLTGVTSQYAQIGESSRQAELERNAALQRTRLMIGGQQSAQIRSLRGPSTTGLDAFGKPLAGSLAEAQANALKRRLSQPSGGGAALQPMGGKGLDSPTAPDITGGSMGVGTTGSDWTPGGFAGSADGEQYVYNEQGQIVKESGYAGGGGAGAGGGVATGVQAAVETRTGTQGGYTLSDIRNARTFEEYSRIAQAMGGNVGSRTEWEASRKRY